MHNKIYAIPVEIMQGTGEEVRRFYFYTPVVCVCVTRPVAVVGPNPCHVVPAAVQVSLWPESSRHFSHAGLTMLRESRRGGCALTCQGVCLCVRPCTFVRVH